MSDDIADGRPEVMWAGKYIRAIRNGRWEYASRTRDIRAVVILAEVDGKVVLIEQERVPIGRRCLELPAGLVGDEDENATVEGTAIKELEEETGYTARHIERIGEFYSSPGMVAEGFSLVRATGLSKIGGGGGTEHEDIEVHLVARADIPALVVAKRAAGVGIDVKLTMLLAL
ncbi:MAG: NUDIX hydrolase [Sphingomonas sp.]|nr:NUDIX hydrolase [Sphingomonas sp.]